jgi:cytochrome P450
VWSLTRIADVREASGNPAVFSSRWGPSFTGNPKIEDRSPEFVMAVDPPEHDRLRHFFKLAFGPKVVRNFESWIRELSLEIIAKVHREEGSFDFIHSVAAELPASVIAVILGMPPEDRHLMVEWANEVFAVTDGTPEGLQRSLDAQQKLSIYALELREKMRREPGDDMVSMLIDAEYQGVPLTDEEYRWFALTTMSAGYETTHTAIAQAMLYLMTHPEAYAEFHSLDDNGINNALNELLRYVSPAMQMSRMTTRDVEIDGVAIPKGEEVIMWYMAANRDPAAFENPHVVDFKRRNNAHATFGAGGPHFCIGNQLARLEMRILFEEFFRHDIRFELAGEPERLKSMMINGLKRMPVKLSR